MKNNKVTNLRDYSTTHTLETIRQSKRRRKVRRRATAITFFGLLVIGLSALPVVKNLNASEQYEKQSVVLTKELEAVEQTKKELEYQEALLEDDEYIAKLARKELNLSKPNEILINIPEEEVDADSEEDIEETEEAEETEEIDE